MLTTLASYLPPGPGLLPYWLLLTATIALTHTLTTLLAPIPSLKMYSTTKGSAQKSALAARLFGLVDFYSAAIRFYAAYDMENKPLYALATLTYVVMLTHFVGEWVVFGTARGREVSPAVGSTALGVLLMMLGWWE